MGEAMPYARFRMLWLIGLIFLLALSTAAAEPVQLTLAPTSEYHPEWTPDGHYVVYTVSDGSTPTLAKVNVSSLDVTPIEITGAGNDVDFDFGISGDGTQVVFDARNPSGMGMVLYIAPLEGGPVENPGGGGVFTGIHPAWSPVDNKIVYHLGGIGVQGLHIFDLDDHTTTPLLTPDLEVMHPSFSYEDRKSVV